MAAMRPTIVEMEGSIPILGICKLNASWQMVSVLSGITDIACS